MRATTKRPTAGALDWYVFSYKGQIIDQGEDKGAEFCIRARKLGVGAVVESVTHPKHGYPPFGFHATFGDADKDPNSEDWQHIVTIRPATELERIDITFSYTTYEGSGYTPAELPDFDVYVREHYITDSPGFAGAVAFMHWHGGPHLITILTFESFGAGMAWRVLAETSDMNLVSPDRTPQS